VSGFLKKNNKNKIKTNINKATMEKTKPSAGPNRALEVDVEYELHTSAPREEMERYYAQKKATAERKKQKFIEKIKKQEYKIRKYECKIKNNKI